MIVWLKAIHIAALSIWCAGLLILPSLYAQRAELTKGEGLHDAHRLARRLFIAVTSPAAFTAVVAGTALIFLRDVFTIWMMLKLVAVGALVALHVRAGYVVLSVYDPGRLYARWRQAAATVSTLCVIGAILWLVLAKPELSVDGLPVWLREPGTLQSLLETMSPIP